MTTIARPKDVFRWLYWGSFALLIVIAFLMMKKQDRKVIPVLARDLSAYKIVQQHDVMSKEVEATLVTDETVQSVGDLSEHYTLEKIVANQPINKKQICEISDQRLILNTVAALIPAGKAQILSNDLSAGDIVSVAANSDPSKNSAQAIILDRMMVLDVRPVNKGKDLIVAIPIDRWAEYLSSAQNSTLLLIQRVE